MDRRSAFTAAVISLFTWAPALSTLFTSASPAFAGAVDPVERPRVGADGGAPAPVPACVLVRSESRYVPYGYNHVVILQNGCSKVADCTVVTNVNPEPIRASIPAGATGEVLTFSGSPSQTFVPGVRCRLR